MDLKHVNPYDIIKYLTSENERLTAIVQELEQKLAEKEEEEGDTA